MYGEVGNVQSTAKQYKQIDGVFMLSPVVFSVFLSDNQTVTKLVHHLYSHVGLYTFAYFVLVSYPGHYAIQICSTPYHLVAQWGLMYLLNESYCDVMNQ